MQSYSPTHLSQLTSARAHDIANEQRADIRREISVMKTRVIKHCETLSVWIHYRMYLSLGCFIALRNCLAEILIG